ncbi:MAG: tRNA (N(6)-L-threonylcarbamoyladenosine(37)-C(2))-methylthiotransferase MtaB [Bacilli bacterium]|nr:tRNA (N(6)-L-threonylcarbamoyladenosine(37)-C(2))-methylthiotransferase MtaB [Bacilli bacterium]
MKFKVTTLGCKVNSYESMAMIEILKNHGFVEDNEGICDIEIINTCSVTSVADAKSRKMIHRAKKNNPNVIIVVTGCYAQVSSEDIKNFENVDIVIGTKYRDEIYDLINEYLTNKKQIVKVSNILRVHDYEEMKVTSYAENTRAYLKIQDGCNNFCSYCIIPYTRGPVRSRDKENVFNETKELINKGFKEIVLTGIHTAGYGTDLQNYSFNDLLKDLVKIDGLKRLRISSIEDSEIDDEFINIVKNSGVIVNHLHIPLQSGSESVVKRMNRKYKLSDYYDTIVKIKQQMPDIAITTDVIVGFPGETEEEFLETYDFIKKVNFAELHVFPYSKRNGTIAARMKDQVSNDVKKSRVHKLIELSEELNLAYRNEFLNKEVDVLFETVEGEYAIGHSTNYIKVKCLGDSSDLNKIYRVKIIENQKDFSIAKKIELIG